MRLVGYLLLAPLVIGALERLGAPQAELHDPVWRERVGGDTEAVDHGAWAGFLARYLEIRTGDANRLDYAAVTPADRAALSAYVDALEVIDPATLSGPEQLAYWINLYNAGTVELILAHFPLESIRDIGGGLFEDGPWDRELFTVKGRALSLNDVEHGIIRPVWPDEPRIHYAVNCAAVGCPELGPVPYSGARIEDQLAAAERAFVNGPHGVRLEGGDLVLSKIWLWYRDDFAADEAGLLAYLSGIAEGPAAAALAGRDGADRYVYDWALNAP